MYAVQDVPGKGKGLIATQDISKGTRIICEKPIILVPQAMGNGPALKTLICQQVDDLHEDQRKVFLGMHTIDPYKNNVEKYLSIIKLNALPIDGGGGIFLDACRINHACDCNSHPYWNDNIQRHTVHALRDIGKGQEITISYIGPPTNRAARRVSLEAKFGFICCCHLCSLPSGQSRESDHILEEIIQLDREIARGGLDVLVQSPSRILDCIDQKVRLYNKWHAYEANLPSTYGDAARTCIVNGDLARGRIFLDKAISGWRIIHGPDDDLVIEQSQIAKDVSKHELCGLSTAWKTSVDNVPSGLDPAAFDDWLWRREKSVASEALVGLRNRKMFPNFHGLPDEMFGRMPDRSDEQDIWSRRHWCFLGEIVGLGYLVRVQLDLKDSTGFKMSLLFHTDGRGSEMAKGLLVKGHTVAILYPEQHAFMFSPPGIRQEDTKTIKIFPASLDTLLALSDRVHEFGTECDGLQKCHGCGKKSIRVSLKQCAGCLSFWYCNKACQTTGWNSKGHKADCKLLRDPSLRALIALKWDDFDGKVQFPLMPPGAA